MTSSLLFGTGMIRPTSGDLDRYTGRSARSMLTRAASHVTADPTKVGQWLAPSAEQWVANAGPLVAQNGVTVLEWAGDGVPLIPVVDQGFAVALQAAQKDEVASRSAIVDAGSDPSTIGGYVNVARQLIDWQSRSADLVFALFDVAASVGLDVWICDQLNTAASTGHADLDAALDSFARDGLYTPSVIAAKPSYITANADAINVLATAGVRIIADHRLVRPLVLDPLAAVFVASTPVIETVDEPALVGVQVGVSRYVSAGVSSAGVAAIG